MLQIGVAFFYYKLEKTLLQVGVASLLKIGVSAVTNWGSYYKLGQTLLLNRETITNWGKTYSKLGQVLQIREIITNLGITNLFPNIWFSKEFLACIDCFGQFPKFYLRLVFSAYFLHSFSIKIKLTFILYQLSKFQYQTYFPCQEVK